MDTDNIEFRIIKEEVTYSEDEEGNKIKVITRTVEKKTKYYENIKKAVYKYRENNKEKINKQISERRKERYQNDEEYREQLKQKRRERYLKNKNKNEEINLV